MSPLAMKWGKKKATNDVVNLEITSVHQFTPPVTVNTSSRLKKVYSSSTEELHLPNDFLPDAPIFSLWCPNFLVPQKKDDLLKLEYNFNIFEVAGPAKIYKWIQAASLPSCAIAHHLELREHFDSKVIAKLKEELVKLKEAHAKEIRSLEEKIKKAKDKYSAKEQE